MKILHIISGDLWAGAEVQAFTLLTHLQQQPGTQVAAALLNEGTLAEHLRASGVPVTILPESRVSSPQIVLALRRLMLKWRPDVVHTHRTKENVLGAIANLLAARVPCVRTAHGAPESSPRGWRQFHKRLFPALDRWCGRNLQQRIIAVSAELASKLRQSYGAEQIAIIENGVDVERLGASVRPVDFRAYRPQAVHIGIVGRLVPVKRVDLFLEAARLLLQRSPQRRWCCHVFGDGPLLARLQAQAATLQLTDIVTFHGHRSDIGSCLAALDVLTLSSDHEGLPMTLLESLALGTPVVAHAVGGMTQVIENCRGGILVREQHAAAYAAAIEELLASEDATQRRERAALLAAQYSAQRNAQSVRAVYDAVAPRLLDPSAATS